jgi:hypothetical protein
MIGGRAVRHGYEGQEYIGSIDDSGPMSVDTARYAYRKSLTCKKPNLPISLSLRHTHTFSLSLLSLSLSTHLSLYLSLSY